MKRKLKILMINDLGYKYGGAQVYLFEIAKLLRKLGHVVKIMTSDLNPKKEHICDYEFKHFNEENFFSKFRGYLFNINSYNKLKQVLNDFKPDIVHLNYIFGQTSPSILLCLDNIPTIITLHGATLICPIDRIDSNKEICLSNFGSTKCINCLKITYPYQIFKFYTYKYLSGNINKFISVSNYVKSYFIQNNYCSKDKIKVIHSGINLLKYSPIKNFNNLLYVGRLPKEKGVDYLIKSIVKVKEYNKSVKLYIAGSGDEEKNLRLLVKKLCLEKNVIFLGNVPYNKIGKFYKKSSILVVPSICPESFGLIGPEAMSTGRPIIASNVGGIPEWLEDGKTGFLVKPGDSDAIAEKVIYLLKRPKLMKKMGLEGRKKAEKEFDIKNYVKKIEKLYLRVIKESKKK